MYYLCFNWTKKKYFQNRNYPNQEGENIFSLSWMQNRRISIEDSRHIPRLANIWMLSRVKELF